MMVIDRLCARKKFTGADVVDLNISFEQHPTTNWGPALFFALRYSTIL